MAAPHYTGNTHTRSDGVTTSDGLRVRSHTRARTR